MIGGGRMLFENLTVSRIMVHDVHRRRDDKKAVPPTYGTALIRLNDEAMDYFVSVVVTAMGNQSQSMTMDITTPLAPGAAVTVAEELLACDDAAFLEKSRLFADKLTTAQARRDIPPGVLVVFDGTVGHPSRRFVGLIKSETHRGLRHASPDQVQFLKDLFLGPQAKLYKVGVFVWNDESSEVPAGGWSAHIYDSQMTAANRDGAAHYFYGGFLGCDLPANAAQLTKRFYDETRSFINKTDLAVEDKADLLTGLYTYLKVDQSSLVEVGAFAKAYMADEDLQDAYAAFMRKKSFPNTAVLKDISDIGSRLRRRRLSFSRNIQLTAPSEAFEDLVEVKSIQPLDGSAGDADMWTQITIRDRIRDQE